MKIQNVDKGEPMWIIFTFYNIIIKSTNDKGGGGKPLSTKCGYEDVFVLTPP